VHTALGDFDGTSTINVAGNSWSSSFLEMLPRHIGIAPHSVYVKTEEVPLSRIDSIFERYVSDGERAFLKIDTQGFTSKVIAGAELSLERIGALEVELSTIGLYEGEPLIHEVISLLSSKGFSVFHLEPELVDRQTGQQLQLNGMFVRTSFGPAPL